MSSHNLSIPEPILRARVAIIRDRAEAEQDIAAKNFKDLMAERRRSYRLKENLLLSLMMNIACILTLIRIVLGSGEMNMVSKIGLTVCLLVVGALPGWRLRMLFTKKE